jgi:hypothetical protein
MLVTLTRVGLGWPSPRLKDASFSKKKAKTLYHTVVTLMRQMYQTCKLVHGDLSEYNMLYVALDLQHGYALTESMQLSRRCHHHYRCFTSCGTKPSTRFGVLAS